MCTHLNFKAHLHFYRIYILILNHGKCLRDQVSLLPFKNDKAESVHPTCSMSVWKWQKKDLESKPDSRGFSSDHVCIIKLASGNGYGPIKFSPWYRTVATQVLQPQIRLVSPLPEFRC